MLLRNCAAPSGGTFCWPCYWRAASSMMAVMPGAPASFERSWNAALGAAQDVGIAVTAADRSSGLIQGRHNAATATIAVIPQADGRLRIQFDARGLGPQDQGLEDRFVHAYNRRMGR